MFQNYQHFIENDTCILKEIVQETQNGVEILVDHVVFVLLIYGKQWKYCFDQ